MLHAASKMERARSRLASAGLPRRPARGGIRAHARLENLRGMEAGEKNHGRDEGWTHERLDRWNKKRNEITVEGEVMFELS